ncbi:mast cell protease 8-like [Thalassophryne amazonica]|uniref:mast cell protease 8-like n=1 Tax=Thalassophryne amazonica TaxID=390379 RepID=UPI001471A85E|nr:mast cell protease 8-like [Thalassophryne amazonica]
MMNGLQKLLLFFVLTFEQNALGSQIIMGQKVEDNDMLYMVSVQNHLGHVCGGFLISDQFVLTAAHCDSVKPTSVVVGTHNLKVVDDEMRYGIKTCIPPSFVNVLKWNDIMLLKLSEKVQLGEKIQTVPLPKYEIKMKDKKECRVAGWGLNRTLDVVFDLQVVDVPIINPKVCKKAWKSLSKFFPDNILCAGGYGTEKGTCLGDFGGPLVCDGMAVGIMSLKRFGICNYPDLPNVYTDVSKFLPWINKILKQNGC